MKQIITLSMLLVGGVLVNSGVIIPAILSNPEFPSIVNFSVATCDIVAFGWLFGAGCERIRDLWLSTRSYVNE